MKDDIQTRDQPGPDRASQGGLSRRPPGSGLSDAAKRWQEENREAIDSMNAYVREHGLPLEKYRRF